MKLLNEDKVLILIDDCQEELFKGDHDIGGILRHDGDMHCLYLFNWHVDHSSPSPPLTD